MARLSNFVYRVDTGEPFKTGNATILGPDGATLATPALNGTTGRWFWEANGQPGITVQTYNADGQFKRIDGSAYGQAGATMEGEIEEILKLFGDGVITGMGLTAPGSMQVQVGVGKGLNLGFLHPIYTAENVTIETADVSNPRIDRVVSRLTRTGTFAGRVVLAVVKGTAAASPAAPALTNTADTNEFEIGRVTVPAGASSIITGNLSIANQAVASGPVSPNSVGTTELADGSVTTPKIADGSVTLEKLASGVIGPALTPGLQTNYYISAKETLGGGVGAVSRTANIIYATPIYIPAETTVSRIGFYAAETIGQFAYFGIYAIGDDGGPDVAIYRSGSISTSGAAGLYTTTISQVLAQGWYWLAQVGTFVTTVYGLTTSFGYGPRSIWGNTSGNPGASGNYAAVATFTGAMPDPFPAYSPTVNAPLTMIRTSGS